MRDRGGRRPEELSTLGVGDPAARGAELVLRVVRGDATWAQPLPPRGELVIGRARDAAVHIDDPSVSRRHAILRVGPPLTLEDLGSANGTRVGDRRLAPGERAPLAPGASAEIGSVVVMVQRAAGAPRARRVWPHAYFEGRVEDECARAGRAGAPFTVARLRVDAALAPAQLGELFASRLRAEDVVASFAPREYELLLVGLDGPAAARVVDALAADLAARGARVARGLASFPRDCRTADELLAASSAAGAPAGARATRFEGGLFERMAGVIARLAASPISVLLLGETGVGKDVMTELIHRRSPRADKPLVRLNCAALSESLLASELFGHEKGAFTGADAAKPGLLETADGGTVFLDEIGELPLALQAKLLRVLEERAVLRVGGLRPRPIDVRFVSATNRDLGAEIAAGRFREDLYHRLDGFSLVIPPLRERTDEIPPLAAMFAAEAARRAGSAPPAFSDDALSLLLSYRWRGNVRELRNVVERAVLLCDGPVIGREHLPLEKLAPAPASAVLTVAPPPPSAEALKDELQALEKKRVLEALAACGGNQTRAAKALGISRNTLAARLEAFGVPRPKRG